VKRGDAQSAVESVPFTEAGSAPRSVTVQGEQLEAHGDAQLLGVGPFGGEADGIDVLADGEPGGIDREAVGARGGPGGGTEHDPAAAEFGGDGEAEPFTGAVNAERDVVLPERGAAGEGGVGEFGGGGRERADLPGREEVVESAGRERARGQ
jgi:hypothetical protein